MKLQHRFSTFLKQTVYKECHFHVFVGDAIHIIKPKFSFFSNRIDEVAIQVPKMTQRKATASTTTVFPSEKMTGLLECVYYGKGHS